MASGSILTIWNRSLGSIGARAQVEAINEGSAESNACNTFYQSTYEQLARSAQWGCLRKQSTLTLLLSAPGTPNNPDGTVKPWPPNPWRYTYAVPSDSLYIQKMVPPPQFLQQSGAPPIYPQGTYLEWGRATNRVIPYQIGYGTDLNNNPSEVINTNLGAAQAIYTVNQPNPIFWDSSFQSAMVASLAAYLVPALSLDKSLMQAQIGIAKDLIAQAKARDGNESPVSQQREAPWIQARTGSPLYNLGYNTSAQNYEMTWPL